MEIFLSCCQTAADMPLCLIHFQHLTDRLRQFRVYPLHPIRDILVHRRFEIPNFFAVSRTVAFVVIINFATSTARSSIYVFKPSTPLSIAWLCICRSRVGYESLFSVIASSSVPDTLCQWEAPPHYNNPLRCPSHERQNPPECRRHRLYPWDRRF